MKASCLLLLSASLICIILAVIGALLTPENIPEALPNTPQKIITLAPNLTEIAFALGLGQKIVAVSSDSDFPPEAKNKKTVGSFWQPDIESIIAAKPDIVIALANEQHKPTTESLERLNYQVLGLKLDRLQDLFEAIEKIADNLHCSRKSDEIISQIKSGMNSLRNKLTNCSKVTVLWIIQSEPLRIAGKNTFINDVIELAGGTNAIGSTIQKYPSLSSEQLLAAAPEVIIQSTMGKEPLDSQQQLAKKFWSKWPNLPAVKNNRIYVIDSDILLRLGPRLPEGIETIAKILHPEKYSHNKTGK